MKHFFYRSQIVLIAFILALASFDSHGQGLQKMNSILKSRSSSIRISSFYENGQEQVKCRIQNPLVYQDDDALTIKFEVIFNIYSSGGDTIMSWDELSFNLRTAEIFTGDWQYLFYLRKYYQGGDLKVLTIRDPGRIMKKTKSNSTSNRGATHSFSGNIIKITFPSEEIARDFLESIKTIQQPYKEFEEWEKPDETEMPTSLSLEGIFNQFKDDFTSYEIISRQGKNSSMFKPKMKNKAVYFDGHLLVISYDDTLPNGAWSSGFTEGHWIIYIPIKECKVDYQSDYLIISSDSGINVLSNGEKSLKTSFSFYSTNLLSKQLCTELKQFQKKLKEENYSGTLGSPSSKSKSSPTKQMTTDSNSSKRTISNKYEQ